MATATAEPTGSSGRLVAVATGAVAATLVVVLAITILPRRAPAPVAVSATTLPPFTVSAAASVASDQASVERSELDQVRLERTALASPSGLALTGAPRSIAVPVVAAEEPRAGELPADAVVHLVTSSHVYRLAWADLDRTIAPDGTLVLDDRGHVVGSFIDGRFVRD